MDWRAIGEARASAMQNDAAKPIKRDDRSIERRLINFVTVRKLSSGRCPIDIRISRLRKNAGRHLARHVTGAELCCARLATD